MTTVPKHRKSPGKSPRILKQRPIHGTIVKLPDPLVAAWRRTIIALARPPKSFKPFRSDEQRFQAIAKAECESVQELWEIFTTDRERLGRYLMDSNRQTIAYLLGFHLVNSSRLWHGLVESNTRHDWYKRTGVITAINKIMPNRCPRLI